MERETLKFSDLEQCDLSVIEHVPWAKKMYSNLQDGLQIGFLNWCKYVLNLANGPQQIEEWSSLYMNLFEQTICDFVYDMTMLQMRVMKKIESLLQELQEICDDLKMDMPVVGSEDLSLYEEHARLKKLINEYGVARDVRKKELNDLKQQQTELCKSLGKEPLIIKDHPLPSASEIEDLKRHIENLESEKYNREEKYFIVKEEICTLAAELNAKPSSEFERQVLCGNDHEFMVTTENMRYLDNFHRMLKRDLEKAKEEATRLRQNINDLWNILEIDIIEREEFKRKYVGHTLDVLEGLRSEYQKYRELKKANIKVFVEKLRKDLEDLWENCQCGGVERSEFQFMYSDCYTEDLLELHEVEIARWTKYYEENKELLELLVQHHKLWNRLTELEENSTGPNRYKNRGGQLLKEEKERNVLSKKIPKIEEDIKNLALVFQERNEFEFKTFGRTVDEYITNLHEERTMQKKLKLSARKQQRDQTVHQTPSKLCTNLFPSTSTSCLRTPASTTKRKIPQTPSTDTKKLKREQTPRSVLKQKNIPIKITVVSSRRSMEKAQKKNLKRRSANKKRPGYANTDTSTSTEYNDFENEISSRAEIRSTLLVPDAIPEQPRSTRSQKTTAATKVRSTLKTPTPLGTTPQASSAKRKTPRSAPRSPGAGTSKFSACKSNLKLIF